MKKKISILIAVLLTLVVCFSFAACSLFEGKSAYEIAVENGFTGTEQQWLESLNGKDGQDSSIDIYDLFEAYLSEYPDATFSEFLQTYSVVELYNSEYAVAKGIQSAVSVYSTFSRKSSRPGQSTEYMSGGAGVAYRIENGYVYIITNYHVVYDRDSAAANGIGKNRQAFYIP